MFPVRVKREGDHWRATDAVSGWGRKKKKKKKGSNIFSLSAGEKRVIAAKTTTSDQQNPPFPPPSISLSVSTSLTLSDLIPALHLRSSIAAEISREASFERKISFAVSFSSLCRSHGPQPTQPWQIWEGFVKVNKQTDYYTYSCRCHILLYSHNNILRRSDKVNNIDYVLWSISERNKLFGNIK